MENVRILLKIRILILKVGYRCIAYYFITVFLDLMNVFLRHNVYSEIVDGFSYK